MIDVYIDNLYLMDRMVVLTEVTTNTTDTTYRN